MYVHVKMSLNISGNRVWANVGSNLGRQHDVHGDRHGAAVQNHRVHPIKL